MLVPYSTDNIGNTGMNEMAGVHRNTGVYKAGEICLLWDVYNGQDLLLEGIHRIEL